MEKGAASGDTSTTGETAHTCTRFVYLGCDAYRASETCATGIAMGSVSSQDLHWAPEGYEDVEQSYDGPCRVLIGVCQECGRVRGFDPVKAAQEVAAMVQEQAARAESEAESRREQDMLDALRAKRAKMSKA